MSYFKMKNFLEQKMLDKLLLKKRNLKKNWINTLTAKIEVKALHLLSKIALLQKRLTKTNIVSAKYMAEFYIFLKDIILS